MYFKIIWLKNLSLKKKVVICQVHMLKKFGISYASSHCQTWQFVKSIHNSSLISLAPACWLPCYPTNDGYGSEVLWDPDGTFLTIRFGLPLENGPLAVCNTNVSSSSASNEMMLLNENCKNAASVSSSWFKWKLRKACFVLACLWNMWQTICIYALFDKI